MADTCTLCRPILLEQSPLIEIFITLLPMWQVMTHALHSVVWEIWMTYRTRSGHTTRSTEFNSDATHQIARSAPNWWHLVRLILFLALRMLLYVSVGCHWKLETGQRWEPIQGTRLHWKGTTHALWIALAFHGRTSSSIQKLNLSNSKQRKCASCHWFAATNTKTASIRGTPLRLWT